MANKLQRLFRNWMAPPPGHDWVLEAEWARIQQKPLKAKAMLYCTAFFLLMLLVWAYFAPIDEVARGEGKVIPASKLQVVQSFDGGIVQSILVKEGQVVEEGDVLLKIDPTRFLSNLQENSTQYNAVAAKVQRLTALLQDLPLTFPDQLASDAFTIVENEKRLYESSKNELREVMRGFDNRIAQRKQEVAGTSAELAQYKEALLLTRQELDVTKPLLSSGAVSQMDILRIDRQVVELSGSVQRTLAVLASTKAALKEEINSKEESRLRFTSKWNQELAESLAKLAGLKESQASLSDVVEQAALRSPVKGTVQRLLVNTIGGVVTPGSQVAEIIPYDDQLIVEAKISPKDIAFIRIGQKAILKFSAYDYAIFGGMEAQVEHISADTITDEQDNTYYIIRLHTVKAISDTTIDIIPGMTVQVDVITGKRTVLQFILKPLLRVTSSAFQER
ncbi:HlyD family type I secretion periplasmic adaptor subunit [Alteromonas sp. C1M14]|uniref:HlyD family type I secretion periplasmic adaptor subunit n=1 Tax=Alteromonas sp. C1M14 TaxID=2841567 RepID=UPI001C098A15|nr:HlyD family type I secretion periplasmic adaptor subunit [Alteromonas sp. C1M14]MBU2977207.1 HlyD family type I secretion periplasmic adaptor subunit [Alteromonas sp. C1M14]